MFQQLLREESVRLGIEAKNQKELLTQMIDYLPGWELDAEKKESLLHLLLARERFGTTALGEGLALPHGIFSGITCPMACLVINREGLPFPSLDGALVHIAFLLVLPETEDSDREKRKILHSAESFFRDRFLMERLKIAESASEAYEVILREGHHMTEVFNRVQAAGARA